MSVGDNGDALIVMGYFSFFDGFLWCLKFLSNRSTGIMSCIEFNWRKVLL